MSIPYTRFFWSDWNADTSHLDLMQLGAYIKLISHMYQHERPLPADLDRVYRICHATSPTEQNAIRIVLEEFFILSEDPEHGDQYRHLRVEREIEWSAKAHNAMSEAGKRGAAKRWGNSTPNSHPNSPPNSNQNQNQNHNHNQVNTQTTSESETRAEISRSAAVPFSKIQELWAEILPELPQPVKLSNARKAQIRARWNDELPDLDSWRECFGYIRRSNFLMGRTPPTNGHRQFRCTLDWITKQENLLKLYEGRYKNA